MLLGTEWLDNVPLDVAEVDEDGRIRRVLVGADGSESLGADVDAADRFWLARWWAGAAPGDRIEIGSAILTFETGARAQDRARD